MRREREDERKGQQNRLSGYNVAGQDMPALAGDRFLQFGGVHGDVCLPGATSDTSCHEIDIESHGSRRH
jgi:hypothetical protein